MLALALIYQEMSLYQVRVTTEAKRDSIRKDGKVLVVSVRVTAERNQANIAALKLIKAFLKTKRIELVSGHHKPHKIIRVA